MIRILHMDRKDEFENESIEDIQDNFFCENLPTRKDDNGEGKYLYKKNSINADEGSTLILFQYDNKIIAIANLNKIVKFPKPEGEYNGAFYFDPKSIKVFTPLSNEEINDIFGCNIIFGQTKHSLEVGCADEFMSKLVNI